MLSRFHSRGPTYDFGSVTRIVLCLFIHNIRSKHSRKTTAQALLSILTVQSISCTTVDFLVLDVFNSNNLLSEAVVGLKLFYPKSFRKQFCAVLKAPNFMFTSHPQNLCQHNLIKACLVFLCFES